MVKVKINTHKKGRPPFVSASLAEAVQKLVDSGLPFPDALRQVTEQLSAASAHKSAPAAMPV